MRRKIVAGNWKMNKSWYQATQLAEAIVKEAGKLPENRVELILCPPFPFLQNIVEIVDNKKVKTGAQNIHDQQEGAYTGEVSAEMIRSVGVSYVLIGHSERRQYFKENEEVLSRKMELALQNELQPIYCCGELLEDREAEEHFNQIRQQLKVIQRLSAEQLKKVIIAYEPVWAIGTGVTASTEQAEEMHAFIRQEITQQFGSEIAEEIPILYGGSCKPENANALFAQPNIDGGLIGGASLKSTDFISIATSFQ